MKQLDAGTFSWNSFEQRAIDKVQKKIDTELQITIESIKYDNKKLSKISSDKLIEVYASLVGQSDISVITDQMNKEVRAYVTNTLPYEKK